MNLADTQSDLTWRKRRLSEVNGLNNVDHLGLTTLKQPRLTSMPYIILAKESPPREQSDSEVSTYDSFHGYETDYCRDTSDTETDEIVLEYEVATSSASEHLYSHDSSSGTDDFVAAAVASAIFDTTSASEQLDFAADTEESDCPSDPELGRADYWKCVKCKNKQNNPLYRFCEKCYQIRKNHFPPRPKQRKSRSRLKQSPYSQSIIQSSTEDENVNNHDQYKRRSASRNSFKTNNRQCIRRSRSGSGCRNGNTQLLPSLYPVEKVQSDVTGSTLVDKRIVERSSSDMGFVNPSVSKVKPPNLLALKSSQESGFSSSACEGISPDGLPTISNNIDACSSQETFCSEFESAIFSAESELISTQDSVKPLSYQGSNLSETSTTSVVSTTRSFSSCSERFPNGDVTLKFSDLNRNIDSDNDASASSQMDDNLKKFDNNYGSCMMCLTQPKNGVFVHSRVLHLCCCYRCAVKIWNKRKRCPVCNGKVNNVMKLFVH